jgi:hypothetical protein
MWKYKIKASDALKIIKGKRKRVEPNFGFLYQLELWSKFLESGRKKAARCISYQETYLLHSCITKEDAVQILKNSEFAFFQLCTNFLIYHPEQGQDSEIGKQALSLLKIIQKYENGPEEIIYTQKGDEDTIDKMELD